MTALTKTSKRSMLSAGILAYRKGAARARGSARSSRRSVLAQEGRWRLVHPEGRNRYRGRSRAGRAT